MPQRRDHSKSENLEGRTGEADAGSFPRSSLASPEGGHPRVEGRGLAPAGTAAGPAEEATFSQGGGSMTQPGGVKRLISDESEDAGHFDRADATPRVVERYKNTRSRGAAKAGADRPRS